MPNELMLALRRLVRRPGVALAIIITIATGVGATTAIYSALRSVILRPFPYPELDRLVAISETNLGLNLSKFSVAYTNYVDWQAEARSFQEFAVQRDNFLILSGSDRPQRLTAVEVSTNWFSMLGVPMVSGRPITARDSADTSGRVVVLSTNLWRSVFGEDPSLIGKSIMLNDVSYRVLGVAHPRMHSPADLWVPLSLPTILATNRRAHGVRVVARLAPGVSLRSARAELTLIASRLADAYPESNRGWTVEAEPLVDNVAGKSGPALVVLMLAAVFVLLIASANVANILLVRGMTRMPEFTLRLALGANRRDLFRDVLAEITVLSLVGGALGVGLAVAAMRSFQDSWSVISPVADVTLEPSGLVVALSASILALLLGGLPPALLVTRRTVTAQLRRTTASRGIIRSRTQSGLIVVQSALAILLLTGATLLLKALVQLSNTDLGFEHENVATAMFTLPRPGYESLAAQRAFVDQLLAQLKAQPDLRAAAVSDVVPGGSGQGLIYFGIPGRTFDPTSEPASQIRLASPDYFRVLQIGLVRGRTFGNEDREGSIRVAIVDALLAQRYFPDEDPIGRQVMVQLGPNDTLPRQIVGIVRHARHTGPDGEDQPTLYVPAAQAVARGGTMSILVRADTDVEAIPKLLREQLHDVAPNVPIYDEQTLSTRVANTIGPVRFLTSFAALFGACAVFLACVGVYGVLSFSVAQRTREIGVRLALGAHPGRVVLDVVRNGLALTGTGVLVGVGLALWTTRLLSALLSAVSPTDAPSFLMASSVFLLVAAVASLIPARRAGRVDPLITIRAE